MWKENGSAGGHAKILVREGIECPLSVAHVYKDEFCYGLLIRLSHACLKREVIICSLCTGQHY